MAQNPQGKLTSEFEFLSIKLFLFLNKIQFLKIGVILRKDRKSFSLLIPFKADKSHCFFMLSKVEKALFKVLLEFIATEVTAKLSRFLIESSDF